MIDVLHIRCPESKIICCYGLMEANDSLNKAIASIPNDYDFVYPCEFDLCTNYGGVGHPGVLANKTAGEKLAQVIKEGLED